MPPKRATFNDMVYESKRYETFSHWPYGSDVKCNPEKMAEAGFYAPGGPDEPDLAVCFLCGKEMDGWEENDDPWIEHRDHAAQCMFVQLNKPEKDMTIEEFLGLCHQFNVNKVKSEHDNILKQFEREVELLKLGLSKGK